jgi:hypothetical protein
MKLVRPERSLECLVTVDAGAVRKVDRRDGVRDPATPSVLSCGHRHAWLRESRGTEGHGGADDDGPPTQLRCTVVGRVEHGRFE